MVQAPVRALDADGTLVAALGTLGFAVAAVALGFRTAELDAAGHLWWWWVAITGTFIGAVGWVAATARGTRARRADASDGPPSPPE